MPSVFMNSMTPEAVRIMELIGDDSSPIVNWLSADQFAAFQGSEFKSTLATILAEGDLHRLEPS